MLFCGVSAFGQIPKLKFNNYNNDNGLLDNTVYDIIQDDSGLIWIATEEGVDRFDGTTFRHYVENGNDSSSIDEKVNCFMLDSDNELWLGTTNGIQRYDYTNDVFESVHFIGADSLNHFTSVIRLIEDSHHNIWAISENRGLLRYNSYTNEKEIIMQEPSDSRSLPVDQFRTAFLNNDTLWLSTFDNGIVLYDTKTRNWDWLKSNTGSKLTHLSDSITCIEADGDYLWLGSYNRGLYKLNKKTLNYIHYSPRWESADSLHSGYIRSLYNDGKFLYVGTHNSFEVYDRNYGVFDLYDFNDYDEHSIGGTFIQDIFKDKNGNLWIATDQGGISIAPSVKRSFKHEKVTHFRKYFRQNFIMALYEDNDGDLWVGTDGGGLYVKKKGEASHVRVDSAIHIYETGYLDIVADKNGLLWIGTANTGLYSYNKKTKETINYRHEPGNPHSLANNMVYTIVFDENNDVWVGTNGGCVNKLDKKTGKFKRYIANASKLDEYFSSDYITDMFVDSRENIWIASHWGLTWLDPRTDNFINYMHNPADEKSIDANKIFSIDEDSKGSLWFGTNNGLNKFLYNDSSFISYSKYSNHPNSAVHSVAVDELDNVWVSTNYGLSRFNRIEKKFYDFDEYDGLQSNKFKPCVFKKDDMLFFGGVNGYNYFRPIDIQYNTVIPDVYINNVKVFNQSLRPCADCPLEKNIIYANEIVLPHDQNMVEIEFSAMDVVNPNRVMIKYTLEGFDRGWNLTSADKPSVNYSNLPPGEYEFKILASNSDRLWGDNMRKIRLMINPPYWQTKTFYSIAILIFFVLLYMVIRFRERRLFTDKLKLEDLVRERTEEIELMNEEIHLQNKELKDLNSTKDRFFSIIAHDLKNPMNALLGFSQILYERYSNLPEEKRLKMVKMLNDSSTLMYDLLNNLLDWSRSQTGSIKFFPMSVSIVRVVKDNIAIVKQLAENKDITITPDIFSPKNVYVDVNMVNTVFRNLLTNSIKFTPRGGTIFIEVNDEGTSHLSITIKDTGIGMSEDQIKSLFKIDSHRSTNGTENEHGTGLGLIVCKEFVEHNGGHLRVSSKPGIGSRFSFTVPVQK